MHAWYEVVISTSRGPKHVPWRRVAGSKLQHGRIVRNRLEEW